MPVTASAAGLSREPLGHQIATALRNDILAGNLQPGEHLSQQAICKAFGTSRIPVRDALQLLAAEGYVVSEGTGRARVTRLTVEDIRDVYRIEGFLKGMACRRAAERITGAELDELRALHAEIRAALEDGRDEDLVEFNWEFHRRINRISASAKLVAAIRPLAMSVPRGFIALIPDWGQRAVRMQERLLEALGDGDGERAETIAAEHTIQAGAELIDFLRERGIASE